jgi:glyceraldehyde 3-phosphate dehydrogenase
MPLAATAEHGDILGYEEKPLVSTDYNNDTRSTIVDAESTMVVMGNMVKIYAWYDNEIGYSMRTAELARMVANKFIVGLTMASPASLAAGAGAPASCTAC